MKHWICSALVAASMAVTPAVGTAIAGDAPSGTFKMAEEVKLITMDPHQHTGGGIPYLRPVYESLFARTPDGSVEPLLATGFSVDGLSVEISLRDDVTFSDGEKFNAEAVAANFSRAIELGVLRALSSVETAVVKDEYTVALTLKKPAPSLNFDLSGAAGMMISPT